MSCVRGGVKTVTEEGLGRWEGWTRGEGGQIVGGGVSGGGEGVPEGVW